MLRARPGVVRPRRSVRGAADAGPAAGAALVIGLDAQTPSLLPNRLRRVPEAASVGPCAPPAAVGLAESSRASARPPCGSAPGTSPLGPLGSVRSGPATATATACARRPAASGPGVTVERPAACTRFGEVGPGTAAASGVRHPGSLVCTEKHASAASAVHAMNEIAGPRLRRTVSRPAPAGVLLGRAHKSVPGTSKTSHATRATKVQ